MERKNMSAMDCIEFLRYFFFETDKPTTIYRRQDNEKEPELQYCKCRTLFLLDKFVFRYEMDVYCHEHFTSTVPSGQIYLSFVTKWTFIAMSIY